MLLHNKGDYVDPFEYDFIVGKVREFFKSKGLIECHVQNNLTILGACEDPQNLVAFNFMGEKFPLNQTNQMNLEFLLMENPDAEGFYCFTTSYREEKNPNPQRHNQVFPMIEFEIKGGLKELQAFETELLCHLGFDEVCTFKESNYLDICKKYGVDELTHEHEMKLKEDYSEVFFLKNFPEQSSPFWNMKRDPESGTAEKIDVIIGGIETIGSASRSCDPVEMRKRFYTISDGQYAQTLYDKFGKDRVEAELEQFMALKFFPRSGAGIGYHRLAKAMRNLCLLPLTSKKEENKKEEEYKFFGHRCQRCANGILTPYEAMDSNTLTCYPCGGSYPCRFSSEIVLEVIKGVGHGRFYSTEIKNVLESFNGNVAETIKYLSNAIRCRNLSKDEKVPEDKVIYHMSNCQCDSK